jgi:hypothetical protein
VNRQGWEAQLASLVAQTPTNRSAALAGGRFMGLCPEEPSSGWPGDGAAVEALEFPSAEVAFSLTLA